jgi:nucleoside 2-deoxyribosyltransferase
MPSVFISYARKDREFVTRLQHDMEARIPDVHIWYDMLLEPGSSWAATLAQQIERADVILAILSPDYLASEWTTQELNIAMLRRTQGEAKLIPLLVRPCRPTGFLASIHWIDFTGDYEEALARLSWSITGEKPRIARGPEPGSLEQTVPPEEIEKLRVELREAVAMFKSRVEAAGTPAPAPRADGQGKPKKKCFIVMPFADDDLQVVYEDFVRPTVQQCKLDCERGDDVFGSNIIMDDILRSIHAADLILADLTRRNANVFYEVGIAHAVGKPVLLIAQSIDDVPFDLRHRRVLLYEYSPRGCRKLETALPNNIYAALGENNAV